MDIIKWYKEKSLNYWNQSGDSFEPIKSLSSGKKYTLVHNYRTGRKNVVKDIVDGLEWIEKDERFNIRAQFEQRVVWKVLGFLDDMIEKYEERKQSGIKEDGLDIVCSERTDGRIYDYIPFYIPFSDTPYGQMTHSKENTVSSAEDRDKLLKKRKKK